MEHVYIKIMTYILAPVPEGTIDAMEKFEFNKCQCCQIYFNQSYRQARSPK